ncbi:MAG: hypothetical protein KJO09_00635, partial [Gammaproteobacteria bacterium]|nr:hypothetical protein [Gammaproteobacteria bacterium]
MSTVVNIKATGGAEVGGEFVDFAGERYYAILNVDNMGPFFISVISNVDHWLFVSSTGGLTAGRVSPETALFPYVTVDKIHESGLHTGPRTILRVHVDGSRSDWEPFNREHDDRYDLSRNLYKNTLGNKLCFEEINHDLGLEFRYTWATSDDFGFTRQCEIRNTAKRDLQVDLLDGLQNVLPAGTPRFTQTNSSNLVDAYKWTELDESTGLALFTLYSGITDRAEPCESLRANVVYSLGLEAPAILLSSNQLNAFRQGAGVSQETHRRGIRGAYFVNASVDLPAGAARSWQLVANIEQTQAEVVALREQLRRPSDVAAAIEQSVAHGTDDLARIMASSDAFQKTAEENMSVHHYANVLFNVLRGGIFNDQYTVSARDFRETIRIFNQVVYDRNKAQLEGLADKLSFSELRAAVAASGDAQLMRLTGEYLPIRFGRRHGDPSRPWNQFAIHLRDRFGNPLLSYEGNWRDIFQNWEALAFSYPEFVENIIAKFVNASTIDGYNPYRITKEGIDWEVEEPDNPWSYIGYWGDHQIIYLQKMLELSSSFHPSRLRELLREPLFSYANVPYRIREFKALLEDPKSTVYYDEDLAARIEERVKEIGSDGKLILDAEGNVYQVNLLEKLLVPLLAKLGNLVVDGGIWMNTQRPEWNDANNALVGQGLSMVTLCYMRRFVRFLQELLEQESGTFALSSEVGDWLADTAAALSHVRGELGGAPLDASRKYGLLAELGEAASRHRQILYQSETFSGTIDQSLEAVVAMLDDALAAIDHSIANNVRDDGMYHAYNTLDVRDDGLAIDTLYPMLEGQVAALSAGAISPEEAVGVLEGLFASKVYRDDQKSFMLYPDRELPGFLGKNLISADEVAAIPLLQRLLDANDGRVVLQDTDGNYRFNANFANVGDLHEQLDALADTYGDDVHAARGPLHDLFERIFNHQGFTGRSGTMFGFEGLGCIYWHMVSKLLLAVEENFFAAVDAGADAATCKRLGELYYQVRGGIGFNKTPAEYGAFPTDPYSHTPKHNGARQPGMTGQVKEEVLTRFGELGIRVTEGMARIQPALLRASEFVSEPQTFCYLDVEGNWQDMTIPAGGLGFTWCQVPVVYTLDDTA